jgi:phosphatidylglycerophosphate synthase
MLARLINRRISLFLSSRIWRFGITPHMVTAFTLLLGILSGTAFAQGTAAGWGLLGAALFQLQSIIDGVDGELARLMHRQSRFGFWFDVGVDNLTHMAVFGGIARGYMADGIPGCWAALGFFSILGVAASFAVATPLLSPGGENRGFAKGVGTIQKLVELLSKRDFTYLLFPLAAFGWLGGFLWAVAFGTWGYALTVLYLRFRIRKRPSQAIDILADKEVHRRI